MSFISSIVQALVIVAAIYVVFLMASLKWRKMKPISRLYGAVIIGLLVAIAQILWARRGPDRRGGVEVYVPPVEIDIDESAEEEDFPWDQYDFQG